MASPFFNIKCSITAAENIKGNAMSPPPSMALFFFPSFPPLAKGGLAWEKLDFAQRCSASYVPLSLVAGVVCGFIFATRWSKQPDRCGRLGQGLKSTRVHKISLCSYRHHLLRSSPPHNRQTGLEPLISPSPGA